MAETDAPRTRRQRWQDFAHGRTRSDDRRPGGPVPDPHDARPRTRGGAGLCVVLGVTVGLGTAVGIARVHTRTRVLEAGAAISELTAERERLLEERRRLDAERAFLRHPDHIEDVAVRVGNMGPASPRRVRTITMRAPEGS
ncbi:MAG: hypothetical protein KC636_14370 [Myxococcales bacterium]|nr:hypothetical protein [Myxococcales bacterium]